MQELTLKIGQKIDLGNGIVIKLRGSLGNVARFEIQTPEQTEIEPGERIGDLTLQQHRALLDHDL